MKAIKTLFLALFTLLVAACFVVASGPASAEPLAVASGAGTNADDDDDDGDDDGGGAGDAVFGEGAFAGFLTFSVDASSGPLGENPSGTFRADSAGGGFVTAEATCLVVTGNTATFGGRITASGGVGFDPILFAPGRGLFVTFQDNTPATPAPDRISGIQSWPTVPMSQAECLLQPTFFTVDEGDVTVQDNTAAGGGGEDDDDDNGEDDG